MSSVKKAYGYSIVLPPCSPINYPDVKLTFPHEFKSTGNENSSFFLKPSISLRLCVDSRDGWDVIPVASLVSKNCFLKSITHAVSTKLNIIKNIPNTCIRFDAIKQPPFHIDKFHEYDGSIYYLKRSLETMPLVK